MRYLALLAALVLFIVAGVAAVLLIAVGVLPGLVVYLFGGAGYRCITYWDQSGRTQ